MSAKNKRPLSRFSLLGMQPFQRTTLLYFLRQHPDTHLPQIMLAMKKRGFGAGKFNGVGGKQQAEETIVDTCRRESEEECGMRPLELEYKGVIQFSYEGKPHWNNRCSLFLSRSWTGEMQETEEMNPSWMNVEEIPYDKMWPDDLIWMKGLFQPGLIQFNFYFDGDGNVLKHEAMTSLEAIDEASDLVK